MVTYSRDIQWIPLSCCCVFFFKQKTAYDMRNSDWSSDVCSSDLVKRAALDRAVRLPDEQRARRIEPMLARDRLRRVEMLARGEIGRASCRERVCKYV